MGLADRTTRALLWSVVHTGVAASVADARGGRLTLAVQSLMPVVAVGGGVATAIAGVCAGRSVRQRLERILGAVVTAMFSSSLSATPSTVASDVAGVGETSLG